MLRDLLHRLYTSWFRKSSTVRIAFPVVFMTLIIAGAAAVSTSQTSRVVVEVEPQIVAPGTEFTINIYGIAHTPANTVDIEVSYPERQVEILGIDTGESVITLWTEDPKWENGTIYLRGGIFRRGFVGEHLIARVRAKGTQSGSAYITTDGARFLAGDGRGTEIALEDSADAEVYIGGSQNMIRNGDSSDITGRIAIQVVTDLDGNGEVGLNDISIFMSTWRTGKEALDFNGDGRMTFTDFAILLADSFFK